MERIDDRDSLDLLEGVSLPKELDDLNFFGLCTGRYLFGCMCSVIGIVNTL